MKIQHLIDILEKEFPPDIQEDYDNSGTQLLAGDKEITGIMLCLDATPPVIRESARKGCNLIISHHPLLFKPIKRIRLHEGVSDILLELISKGINLFSLHTSLDKIYYDKLASTLGFHDSTVLRKTNILDNGEAAGLGSYSVLDEPVRLESIISRTMNELGCTHVTYTGDTERMVSRIAVINGSGGGMIPKLTERIQIDCLITGDLSYHHAHAAELAGISVIDAGHFHTERILLKFLSEVLHKALTDEGLSDVVGIYISEEEKNPLKVRVRDE